ncbi:MAG: sugar phosphate isomerase/epimerase [Clostridia bacterium]|nr:sugar phosphate isomerase/epimerase [Clostridia bacterium]
MPKLAFSTLPCMEYDADGLKKLCEKYGFSGVEVRTKNNGSFVCGDGLFVTDVGSSFCIKGYDKELLSDIKALTDEIGKQNIPAMRVFLGNFCQRYDAPRVELDYDGIVKMLKEMSDNANCEIWIETHNEFATGKVLKKLLSDIDRENVKIIWDIIHPIEDGETPEETIAYLGDKIAHIHIKDGKKRTDPIWHDYEYTPIGEGELPIKKIVDLLTKNGYDGFFSLEWESLWRKELKDLGWSVDEILQKYIDFMA